MVTVTANIDTEGKKLSVAVDTKGEMQLMRVYIVPHTAWDSRSNGLYDDIAVAEDDDATGETHWEGEFDSKAIDGLDKKMFFIVVIDMDGEEHISIVWYKRPLYLNFMRLSREITEGCCEPPMEFIDLFLRTKTLEYAIKAGEYVEAVKIYDQFFMGKEPKGEVKRGCGCHGR